MARKYNPSENFLDMYISSAILYQTCFQKWSLEFFYTKYTTKVDQWRVTRMSIFDSDISDVYDLLE